MMAHIGGGNYVRAEEVQGVLPYDARKDDAVGRLIRESEKTGRVWNVSGKHRARSVILTDKNLIISFLSPLTITRRLAQAR